HLEDCTACRTVLDRLTAAAGWPCTLPGGGRVPATPPADIPGFQVLGELGRGGHGVVYRARQLDLDRHVALKVLKLGGFASADERRRFLTEAKVVARLH